MMAEYNQGWAARAAANPDDEIIKSGVKPVSFLRAWWKLISRNFSTVWKFHDFSTIIQILREINFGDTTSAKSAVLTHFRVLNFALKEILPFLKAEIYQINKIQCPQKWHKRQF